MTSLRPEECVRATFSSSSSSATKSSSGRCFDSNLCRKEVDADSGDSDDLSISDFSDGEDFD